MIYGFGDFELDEDRFELRKARARVRIEPKVLDLLLLLVRARDRVVLKREMLDALWPGVKVSEASIWRVVMEARRALGDDSQTTIVTTRGRGFRFAATVVERGGKDAPAGGPPSSVRDPSYVGRQASLAAIGARLGDALAGRGGVVWLSGPAGIGKTRMVEEVVRRAETRGAAVLASRAHEAAEVPPFWLWADVLRASTADQDDEATRQILADAAPVLRGQDVPTGAARFALFDAILRYFVEASRRQPLVFVFDDLHWADEPSLRLLEFVARDARKHPWLILGTYRDAALPSDARGRTLGGLIGVTGSLCVPLRSLGLDEVTRLAEIATGQPPSSAFGRALLERSGGNPLYVEQLLKTEWADRAIRAAAQELATTMDLQRGIIETIGRHLDGMSAEGRELLTLAAILGKEFQLAELGVVSGLQPKALLGRVDEAVRASVVHQTPKGPYGFTHALVRDVLYKELTSAARSALHRTVGERLLAHYGEAIDAHVAELADHLLRALPAGDAARAIELGTRAAEQEGRLGRHKRAAKLWQRTAQAFAHLPQPDARQTTVRLSLARALLAAGRRAEAAQAFLDAAVLAQTFARPHELAEAALGYGPLADGAAAERRALLEEALAGLAEGSDGETRRLKAMVAAALEGKA